MNERVGLFGGSFDPIHFGHLISARSLAEQLSFSRVILIPSARPPHKAGVEVSPFQHRFAMARAAVDGDPLFEVSDIEMKRAGPSFTLDTVNEYRIRVGNDSETFWIIGADSLPELPTWHRIRELVRRTRIVTATRPGWKAPNWEALAREVGREAACQLREDCRQTPGIDISASEIRDRAGAGRSIRYLTPRAVESYILEHFLYVLGKGRRESH